jgi:predicted DNA-binding ribbon-helix-helix protein
MIEHKNVRVREKTWTKLKELSTNSELSMTLIIDNLVKEHLSRQAQDTKKPHTEKSMQG